jgi:hypothetical protein
MPWTPKERRELIELARADMFAAHMNIVKLIPRHPR